jgi:4-hydroxybenzoate polyprenyltransferase
MNLPHISAIIRHFRFPNLIIIALVLYLQRCCIVIPGLQKSGIEMAWTGYTFLVLGTVLLAAGGYLVNDYFDTEIDAVNRPEKIVSLQLYRPGALKMTYIIATLAGLMSVAFATFLSGIYVLWLVYLLAAVILLWYSYRLKKVLILGNLAIALASAFTMPAAWLYDLLTLPVLSSAGPQANIFYTAISVRIIVYSLFAFLISFAREIVKDIEDMKGDSLFGCRSLPIVFGVPLAKSVVITSLGLVFLLLCWWQVDLVSNGHPAIAAYLAFAVDLPMVWLSALIIRMRTKAQSHLAGLMAKVIMVTGILSMLLFLF